MNVANKNLFRFRIPHLYKKAKPFVPGKDTFIFSSVQIDFGILPGIAGRPESGSGDESLGLALALLLMSFVGIEKPAHPAADIVALDFRA